MQNSEPLKRWSDIKGMAVVAIDTGAKVGTVEDFYFEPQVHGIRALLIKTGLFGHRTLSTITAIGRDAVTIADEKALIPEQDDNLLPTLPFGKSLLSYRIISENGIIIGTVSDILIDIGTPARLRVDAYELAGGIRERWSGEHNSISSSHIVHYGHDVIIVTNDVAEALHKH